MVISFVLFVISFSGNFMGKYISVLQYTVMVYPGSSKDKEKLQVRSAGIFDKKQSSSKTWNVLSRLDPSVLR